MKQRLLVAAVGVPLLLVVLLALPPIATTLLVCAIAGVAAYELLHTAGKAPRPSAYVLTIVCALACVFNVHAEEIFWPMAAFLLFAGLCLIAVVTHGKENAMPFSDVALCMVGGVLFPMMYSTIAYLRVFSPAFVLMPFVVAFIGDSFSMLGGMAFGKRKFAPHVSPNKTWAGFIAGPVGSALGMVILCLVCRWAWSMELPMWYFALVGVVANVFGQLGDLSMSLIKREVGIKDYSHIFLTHGGMLDRFDSSMFIAPVVYAAVMWMEVAL